MAKRKRSNNDLQNIIQKTKNRATRTSLKPRLNSGVPEEWAVSIPNVAPVVLCYSCYKSGDKSGMRKGPDSDTGRRNISVVICDTDIQ